MMPSHVSDELAALLEGQLAPGAAERVRGHAAACERCAAELDEVRLGLAMVQQLPVAAAPADLWRTIETGLPQAPRIRDRRPATWRLAWAMALLLAAGAGLLSLMRPPAPRWEVTRLAGAATLNARQIQGTALAGPGAAITTGAAGRAQVRIGEIGTVAIEPDSAVRLVTLDPRNHRLALASGSIAASITAPPRLFFVETPSATAIDLGCEYTLQCDRAGNGVLDVTAGWVALEWKGRESLVPAGARCRTQPGRGPGTPYFRDASAALIDALEAFDSSGGFEAVAVVLRESRGRDTLSLWHLLSRVAPGEREAVYERIAAFAPPPARVSKEAALRLDPEALNKWKEELAWTW